MTCGAYELQIGDYVDGTLDQAARETLDLHLAGCAGCRAAVVEVRAVRAAAASLDRHVPAPAVWGRIATAVEAERNRRWWQIGGLRHPQLAAAAVAVAIVAGVATMAWRDLAARGGLGGRAALVAGNAPDPGTRPLVDEGRQLAEDEYAQTIAGLEAIRTDQGQLDPEMDEVVQANLTVVDQAIVESRQRLQDEPENAVAQQSLFEALRSKVELLQNAITLVNAMRQGNQAGAAAIVSGQNQ